MSRLARRRKAAGSMARSSPASRAATTSARRKAAPSSTVTMSSSADIGSVPSWVTVSMLPPMSAMLCATCPIAPGRNAAPRIITWQREPRACGGAPASATVISQSMPSAPAARVTELRSEVMSPCTSMRTVRMSRSRTSTCSTSRTSTSWAASAAKNDAVTPGRSRPVTVASAVVGRITDAFPPGTAPPSSGARRRQPLGSGSRSPSRDRPSRHRPRRVLRRGCGGGDRRAPLPRVA